MISGTLLRVIAVIISVVFVAGSWITTGSPDTSLLSSFSIAVLVCSVSLILWDRYFWKLPPIQAIPGVARNISGTWESTLESLWVDPATGNNPDAKTVYLVIRQTSSKASVTLISNESLSKSSLARVVREEGSWVLHYIYTNEPQVDLRARSPIHHGSGVMSIVGSPVKRLSGSYWTDRDSKGKLTLLRRSAKHADDFEEGENLFTR
jgi:hypothetical protein